MWDTHDYGILFSGPDGTIFQEHSARKAAGKILQNLVVKLVVSVTWEGTHEHLRCDLDTICCDFPVERRNSSHSVLFSNTFKGNTHGLGTSDMWSNLSL